MNRIIVLIAVLLISAPLWGNNQMHIIKGYEKWSEVEILTGLIIGEARGEPIQGKVAVAITVKTRHDNPGWWGRNWREVILKPDQFSCWNDHNAVVIREAYNLKNSLWQGCLTIATNVYLGQMPDTIGKPTHYHTVDDHPEWDKNLIFLKQIGTQNFYHDPEIDK